MTTEKKTAIVIVLHFSLALADNNLGSISALNSVTQCHNLTVVLVPLGNS